MTAHELWERKAYGKCGKVGGYRKVPNGLREEHGIVNSCREVLKIFLIQMKLYLGTGSNAKKVSYLEQEQKRERKGWSKLLSIYFRTK